MAPQLPKSFISMFLREPNNKRLYCDICLPIPLKRRGLHGISCASGNKKTDVLSTSMKSLRVGQGEETAVEQAGLHRQAGSKNR